MRRLIGLCGCRFRPQSKNKRSSKAHSARPRNLQGGLSGEISRSQKGRSTGAVIFYDAQMYSPARLALSFLKSAVEHGAQAANYVEAIGFILKGDRIAAIRVQDRISGEKFEIRGKVVLNAAGPWAEHLLRRCLGVKTNLEFVYSRDTFFMVPRRSVEHHALALRTKYRDPDAIVSRGNRHLFLVPWGDHTLVGVWHNVYTGVPNDFTVTEKNLQEFINDVNEAYPPLALQIKDVSMWNAGLVLLGDNKPETVNVSYGKRSQLIDHQAVDGTKGLVTMIGVRYTTARGVAERAVDLVFKKLGKNPRPSHTSTTPIHGGHIANCDQFEREAIQESPAVKPELIRNLLRNHGSRYQDVLRSMTEAPTLADTVDGSKVIKAEIVHAVRHEMAQKLSDVVFRRTNLGTGGNPGSLALQECAQLMASELGWKMERQQSELRDVIGAFPAILLVEPPADRLGIPDVTFVQRNCGQ